MLKRFEQLTFLIYAIYRDIQKIEKEEMEKHSLRGSYAQYLIALDRNPNGLTPARLCEICDKDKAATSRIISELVKLSLVSRGSGYNATITLTEKGREISGILRERTETAVALAGRGLSDSDRELFYAALNTIHSNLREISKNGIPDKL